MPKLKTRKGVAKRFKLTKKGKIKYAPSGKSHLLSHKKSQKLRQLRRKRIVGGKKEAQYLKTMLPYG